MYHVCKNELHPNAEGVFKKMYTRPPDPTQGIALDSYNQHIYTNNIINSTKFNCLSPKHTKVNTVLT